MSAVQAFLVLGLFGLIDGGFDLLENNASTILVLRKVKTNRPDPRLCRALKPQGKASILTPNPAFSGVSVTMSELETQPKPCVNSCPPS